ncbi:hypothetical protein BaRGS_00006702 [Batillaria attramentaria]|uniref:Uncharacterized protein n=1 Tax=Batillaria attramentaria TaxID=370345 RepID=A0ABD0LQW4_9CAEN
MRPMDVRPNLPGPLIVRRGSFAYKILRRSWPGAGVCGSVAGDVSHVQSSRVWSHCAVLHTLARSPGCCYACHLFYPLHGAFLANPRIARQPDSQDSHICGTAVIPGVFRTPVAIVVY